MEAIPKLFICVPYELYWASEVEIQLTNFRKYGYSAHANYLVYIPHGYTNTYQQYWDKLKLKFPETNFYFYQGDKGVLNLTTIYQPVSRPFMLREHWRAYPELQEQTILYLDSDVLFNRAIDWDQYMTDDICYLSPTPYINADYFASKSKDVIRWKLPEYEQRDPLGELCASVGMDKQVVLDNNQHTGGCQYLLKGVTVELWENLMRDCIILRIAAQRLNAEFFESEDKGFQSWAIGDMCGLLWNLWRLGKTVRTPEELGFCWAADPISYLDKFPYYHNAGISRRVMEIDGREHTMFYKSDLRFRTNVCTPLDIVDYNEVSQDYCSFQYVKAIQAVQQDGPVCTTDKLTY